MYPGLIDSTQELIDTIPCSHTCDIIIYKGIIIIMQVCGRDYIKLTDGINSNMIDKDAIV